MQVDESTQEEMAGGQLRHKKFQELFNVYVSAPFSYKQSLNVETEKAAIANIQESDPTDFKKISGSVLDLCNDYYTFVRIKSERTFSYTIIAYSAALLFFLVSAVFFIVNKTNISYFTVLGTALSGLFGGLIQAHGMQVNKEAKECRINLDRIQRFIIANSACEGLDASEKERMRSEIIRKLVE